MTILPLCDSRIFKVLSVTLVICGMTARAEAQRYLSVANPAPAAPEVTAPGAVVPEVTAPEAVVPEAAAPKAVVPEAAAPTAPAIVPESAPTYYDGMATATLDGDGILADGGSYVADQNQGLVLHNFSQQTYVRNGFGPGAFFIEGFLSQGWSCSGNDSDYLVPVGARDRKGYQMNQLYLSLGRCVAKGDVWAFGGKIDMLFGTDYYYATATGLETNHMNQPKLNGTDPDHPEYRASRNEYGLAIPQAYLEAYSPCFQGVDVKVGHFYSVMGYEATKATENFFCTRSYASLYGMPTTMTGVMTSSRVGERVTLILGAVNEWNGFDTPYDYFSFVGGATFQSYSGRFSLSAIVMAGQQSAAAFQPEGYTEEGTNSSVFNLCAKWYLGCKFSYVAEFTYGSADNDYYCLETNEYKQGRSWYGFSNYLFFQANENLQLGFRFEWFCDPDDTVINGSYGVAWNNEGTSYFDWAFGTNWKPGGRSWLTVRPELRWDSSDWVSFNQEDSGTYDLNSSQSQFTGSLDVIIQF